MPAASRLRRLLFAAVLVCLCWSHAAYSAPASNVILMIADGAGFNTFACASYYRHGELGKEVYDSFPVRLACSTWMLNDDGSEQGYDPEQAWSDFEYGPAAATDSAAAATAMYTGVKTTDGRISTDADGRSLVTIGRLAKSSGRGLGVVTTVPLSHATPACMAAHNESRDNYAAIAAEMLFGPDLDVIIGCGHPEYDDAGRPVADEKAMDFRYVGGREIWRSLQADGAGAGWTLVDSKLEFAALARNPALAPPRLLGVARCRTTLQEKRPKNARRFNRNVPDLPTMSLAALNSLKLNDGGFLLMVEGGAVDWANHDRNLARMVEEQIDFNRAVETVVKWIEANGGWERTLLIVTADHECGCVYGPDAGLPDVFQDPINCGKGVLPDALHYTDSHSNVLVPLYAKGAGAEKLKELAVGKDPRRGAYADNTDIFRCMVSAMGLSAPARPARAAGATTRRPAEGFVLPVDIIRQTALKRLRKGDRDVNAPTYEQP